MLNAAVARIKARSRRQHGRLLPAPPLWRPARVRNRMTPVRFMRELLCLRGVAAALPLRRPGRGSTRSTTTPTRPARRRTCAAAGERRDPRSTQADADPRGRARAAGTDDGARRLGDRALVGLPASPTPTASPSAPAPAGCRTPSTRSGGRGRRRSAGSCCATSRRTRASTGPTSRASTRSTATRSCRPAAFRLPARRARRSGRRGAGLGPHGRERARDDRAPHGRPLGPALAYAAQLGRRLPGPGGAARARGYAPARAPM